MSAKVALCVDEECCRHPELIGLQGESLGSQDWLDVFVGGENARGGIASQDAIGEAWVLSCPDVDPINLAAALKADRPELSVWLVGADEGGSVRSRAHTAGIDEVVGSDAFVRRYHQAKASFSPAAVAEPSAHAPQGAVSEAVDSPVRGIASGSAIVPHHAVAEPAVSLVRAVAEPAALAGSTFLMPVVSGSGGAGKSSVAVMGALIAKTMGYRTLLLDYDLQFGDCAAMLGIDAPLALDEAMAYPAKLDAEIRQNQGFMLLAAPSRVEAAEELAESVPALLNLAAPSFDVVVANTGASWGEYHAALLERSSTALFLIDQRATSIRACRHALGLCARCGIATGQFQFSLNKCSKNAPLSPQDVSAALQGLPVRELADGGRDVEEFLGGGSAFDLLASGNPFCASLERLMADALPSGDLRGGAAPGATSGRKPQRRRGRHGGKSRGWRS